LEDVIKKTRNKHEIVPKNDVLRWIEQITHGIMYSHSRNVIHRDLKPANIFLNQGSVRIGDFGFAKTMVDQNTTTNTVLGTQSYSAPEIRKELGYNHKLDIWGIGIILLDLIYGKTIDFAYEFAVDRKKILSTIESRYDEEMRKFVEFIVQLDPEDRPSAVKIINYLNVMNGNEAEEIEEEVETYSKNEKQLREEITHLKLKIEELQRENIAKDEEMYLIELKQLEEQELSGSIYAPTVKAKSSEKNFLGKIWGISSKKLDVNDGDEINTKEIIFDTKKDPIKGSIYTRHYGIWKSKENGDIQVCLKSHNKGASWALDIFKKNSNFDRIYQVGLSKVIERVYGVVKHSNKYHLVCEAFPGGILQNRLLNLIINMDLKEKVDIAFNVAHALTVLHYSKPPLVFTVLKSQNISFDENDVSKLKNTHCIRMAASAVFDPTLPMVCIPPNKRLELKRDPKTKYDSSDEMYAFGMLMWQILYRKPHEFEKKLPDDENYRPPITTSKDSMEIEYIELMKDCWNEIPDERPNSKKVLYRLGKLKERIDPDSKISGLSGGISGGLLSSTLGKSIQDMKVE
jgi:serine/threonine protein kinase